MDVRVQGSVDGTNFVDMKVLGNWVSGTTAIGHLVYDFDENGVMPFMRLNLDSQNNIDSGPKPFKIVVIPSSI